MLGVNHMNSCELVSTVTAISCAIAKCVPKEELPLITAILGQIASTLATIAVQEEALSARETPIEAIIGSNNIVSSEVPSME